MALIPAEAAILTSPTLQFLAGSAAGAVVGGAAQFGKWVYRDIKGGISNLVHHHGPTKYMDIDSAYKRKYPGSTSDIDRSVRRRIDFDMDQLAVAAGNRTTTNRYVNKVKLRSGRIGRKLQKESEEFIQRWQRVYNFGNNNVAFPDTATQQTNPGITVASWITGHSPTNTNTGRLCLSHAEDIVGPTGAGWRLMPGYLMDITCWRNSTNVYQPHVLQRLAFDNIGNARLVPCAQQADVSSSINSFYSSGVSWAGESGPSGVSLPATTEQKSLLSWSDIRLAIYGAKKRCSKVHVEFIQFKDKKYSMNFHPDGELTENMTQLDRNDVNLFWINEFKRLTFNPLVVNTFLRQKALKVMRSETFCINADDSTNEDPGPPVCHKQYFKRFNRLVNWAWNTQNLTLTANKAGMDDPDYQVTDQGQLLGYANPNSRIYIYIRAEDYEPIDGTSPLSIIAPTVVSSTWGPQVDPAPPGGPSYPTSTNGVYNIATGTEVSATDNIITKKQVTGYNPVSVFNPSNSSIFTAYMPTLSAADPQYASDNHVTFDIIVRNKWRIQT